MKNFVICCSVSEDKNKVKAQGLVDDHAYAIISVHEVRGEKLIKMYNPWGKQEWKGDWCKSSQKWTPEIKK